MPDGVVRHVLLCHLVDEATAHDEREELVDFFRRLPCGAFFQSAPQNTVKISTEGGSKPPRYVSFGEGGAATPAVGARAICGR